MASFFVRSLVLSNPCRNIQAVVILFHMAQGALIGRT